jgi:hypothetical protein
MVERIVGCIEAHELTTCKQGMNPRADIILRKSRPSGDAGHSTDSETTDMTAEDIAKAASQATAQAVTKMLAMTDVTKAHYLGLSEDDRVTFLAKSSDVQNAEAEAAKKKVDDAAAEAAAKAVGASAKEQEMQKRLDAQDAELTALKAKDVERDIQKRAATEFADFPGGEAEVVPLLKVYAGLPTEDRERCEALLKSQCELARKSTQALGGRTEQDIGKAKAAAKRIDDAAKALAAEKSIDYASAYERVTEKAEFAEDVAAVNAGA